MSTVKANSHQVGQSATAANNFTLYQPATPDGTVRLGVGNSGATTADVITASSTGVTIPSVSSNNTFGFKNRIINGGMVIDQRNAGASVTPANSDYLVDRFKYRASQASKFTAQQSTTTATGFINSLLLTSASSLSVGSGDYFFIEQPIEGLNCADLAWGTASAKTITLSFFVRSSLTGTFAGCLENSSGDRSYPFTYSISSANTWGQVSVIIAGDTSGTWLTTNGVGIRLRFNLGCGSTFNGTANAWQAGEYITVSGAINPVATSGATFYITGVQLEVGSQATSFDFRSYGTELALCQRYYWKNTGVPYSFSGSGKGFQAGIVQIQLPLPVTMRIPPSLGYSAVSDFFVETGGTGVSSLTSLTIETNLATVNTLGLNANKSGSFTVGALYWLLPNASSSAYISASAEL